MDLATFRVQFPELSTAPDALVTQLLAVAARNVDSTLFADRFDDAHGYYAAHLLCQSPFGKNSRLDPKSGHTTYLETFEQIRFAVVPSLMVP